MAKHNRQKKRSRSHKKNSSSIVELSRAEQVIGSIEQTTADDIPLTKPTKPFSTSLSVVAVALGSLLAFALWKGIEQIEYKSVNIEAMSSGHPLIAEVVKDHGLLDSEFIQFSEESGSSISIPNGLSKLPQLPPAKVVHHQGNTNTVIATVNKSDRSARNNSVVSLSPRVAVGEIIQQYQQNKSIEKLKLIFDAWKQAPNDSELLDIWSGFLNERNELFIVESLYSQAHKISPDNLMLHRRWAYFYYDRGEYEITSTILARIYTQAIAAEDTNLLHLYASTESKLGSIYLAEEIYRHLFRIEPQEWRWLLALADVFEKGDALPQSQSVYRQLLSMNNIPKSVAVLARKKIAQ